jgi:hypothetical protein
MLVGLGGKAEEPLADRFAPNEKRCDSGTLSVDKTTRRMTASMNRCEKSPCSAVQNA